MTQRQRENAAQYLYDGIIASIGIACTYWSQYKHRKRHQHHRS